MTKGKWFVKHEFNVESENGRGIASTGGYTDNRDIEGTLKENIANAQAIASLPDLIEALQEIERFGFTYYIEKDHYRVSIPIETYNKAKQALQKAGVEV